VATFNLFVDWATAADPCDADNLQLLAMMAGTGSYSSTTVSEYRCHDQSCVHPTDFDRTTQFMRGSNIYLGSDVSGTYFDSFIASIYLWMNKFCFRFVDPCLILLITVILIRVQAVRGVDTCCLW
jgi:hypothetical protein